MNRDRIRFADPERKTIVIALESYARDKSLQVVFDCWRLGRALMERDRGPRKKYSETGFWKERMLKDLERWALE